MADRESRTWAEMVGDFLREVGTLYLIFGILDAQILMRDWVSRGEQSVLRSPPVDAWWYVGVVGVSLLVVFTGALIERLR